MKKLLSLVIVLALVLSFSACSGKVDFGKAPKENALSVKEMSVGVFGAVYFTDVGYADSRNFYLSSRCLNGMNTDKNGYYVYSSVENFNEVTKDAKGIVVYSGLAYALTEEEGREYLTCISDHANNYLSKYEIGKFKESAVNYHNSKSTTVSGGDGLLYPDEAVSG
ncbi:MAG: hypothetical protein J6M16_03380 [Clostridia bacterium]|nr:hypothetical protein [Clostridia bacterium]